MQAYFGVPGKTLVSTLNYSFDKRSLSNSQKQAIITFIEKKRKDNRFIRNWRPIPLINVDAKTASKALATRVKDAIQNLVNHDQTAYVKDRFIGESICIFDNLLELLQIGKIWMIYFLQLIWKKHLTQLNMNSFLQH